MKFFRIIFLLFISLSAIGQVNTLSFQYLGEEQGLTGGLINAIQKDDLGFLWVATREGLFRYDGNRFKSFKGFSDTTQLAVLHDVRGLDKDEKGRLWTGSSQGWLSVIDIQTNTIKSYRLPGEEIKNNTIWSISFNTKGQVWLAFERGAALFDPITETFKIWLSHQFFDRPKTTHYAAVYMIMVDNQQDHIIWIGTRWGHVYYNTLEDKFYRLNMPEQPEQHIKVQRFAINYEQDDSTVYLLGHDMSLMAYHKTKQSWSCLYEKKNPKGDPRFFLKDGEQFWLGTTDEGLGWLDFSTKKTNNEVIERYYKNKSEENMTFPKGFVEYIYKDPTGIVWIGVENKICILVPDIQLFQHRYPTFKENANSFEQFTNAYVQMEGDSLLYFSSRYAGAFHILNRNTGAEERISYDNLIPDKNLDLIWEMTSDKYHNLWLSTNCGIYLYDKQQKKLISPAWDKEKFLASQHSEHCFTDNQDNIWFIGSFTNAIRINPETHQMDVYNCTKNSPDGYPKLERLFDLRVDQEGNLWISDATQIVKFNLDTKEIFNINSITGEDKLSDNGIIDYWFSSENELFVYYKYNGVDRINFSKPVGERVTHLDLQDGLPSNKIHRIVTGDLKNAWLATGNGLSNFNLQTQKFKTYSTTNGLIENDMHKGWYSSMKRISTGEIIFTGTGFFTIFHPDSLIRQVQKTQIRFDELKIFDQTRYENTNINSLEHLSLSYSENYFTLTFSDVSFPYKTMPIYQYRLKGYDTKWRVSSTGQAEYTNVGGGKYKFEIKVVDENGEILGETVTLDIHISFPFWQTWWFISIVIIIIIGTVWNIYNYRVQQIIEKEALKTSFNKKILESEMIALRAQMNPHFMFNSLNSIKSYIIDNEPRVAARYLTKFARLMRLILENSKKEVIAIEEELQALRLYLELEQVRFENQFDFDINVNVEKSLQRILLPPLILQPYVENSIWHGLMHKNGKDGHIQINVEQNEQIIKITISDNGIGRAKANEIKKQQLKQKQSMGMNITLDRLHNYSRSTGNKTEIYIEDLVNQNNQPLGTCVHLNIYL